MANDKKNTNELVPSDDDPTAELEVLEADEFGVDDELEVSAATTDYEQNSATSSRTEGRGTESAADSPPRSNIVDRLQFDLEVLQAKWRGLTTEVEARDEQVRRLNAELKAAKNELQENEQRIAQRDDQIGQLQESLESRDLAYRKLADELAGLQDSVADGDPTDAKKNKELLDALTGQLASRDLENREMHVRLAQVEEYADEVRYKLRLSSASADEASKQLVATEMQLAAASELAVALQAKLDDAQQQSKELEQKIATMNDTHAEEIRTIRFELGDAQATLTEQESMAEQLASDLVQTRGVREELETRLAEAKANYESKLAALQKENKRLQYEAESMNDQLHTKSEAISALLAELANPAQKTEAKAEQEEAVGQVDESVAEHVDDSAYMERDRVARLLIGHIDDQELRFPLFKDRLTIGRTQKNDIQLKSEHVSRRHAVVVIEGDVTRVIDWGSKNGVFVNARRIKEHFLQNGDVVGVGTAEFRYEERPMRDA